MIRGSRVVFYEVGKLEIRDWEQAEPKDGELLIENLCSLVSAGTELSKLYNYHMIPAVYPMNTGYISCGRVLRAGSGTKAKEGSIHLLTMGHLSHLVVPEAALMPVPEGLKPEDAVFTELAAISMRAVRQAEISLGDSVLIAGLGLIGQFAQIFAGLEGGFPVVGLDLSEYRRKIARATGLLFAMNPAEKDFKMRVSEISEGGRFNVCIDSTGTANVIASLPEQTAEFGRIIVLGGVHRKVEMDFYTHIQKRSLRLLGAGAPDPRNWPYDNAANKKLIMKLMLAGKIRTEALRTHFLGFEKAPDMYQMLHEQKDSGMGVVFRWNGY